MTAASSPPRPRLAHSAAITGDDALDLVRRRLHGVDQLDASLFHHPFLGLVFRCSRGDPRRRRRAGARPPAVIIHSTVDLVGGRAFVTEPWDIDDLVEIVDRAEDSGRVRGPMPVVSTTTAVRSAEDAVAVIMQRRRRWERGLEVTLTAEPMVLGKPNWWVTGRRAGRPLEIVVDGITGRYFAFRA